MKNRFHRPRVQTEMAAEGQDTSTMEPTFHANKFHCPHCQVYAHQVWYLTFAFVPGPGGSRDHKDIVENLLINYCQRCEKYCAWVDETLIYPPNSTAPMPVSDMPEDVQEDFLEARSVFDRSPKSAAALMRLGLQKLMVHIGERGKDLNTDIGNLVRKGLPVEVQQALDTMRVIGNNAVHPGQIDLDDSKETASALFKLLNFIVDRMITHPKSIADIYGSLPQSNRDAIDKRDGKK